MQLGRILITVVLVVCLPAAAAAQTAGSVSSQAPVQTAATQKPAAATTKGVPLGPATNTTFDSGAGETTFSGSLTGADNLVKNGTGVLTLTGVNTYSGATTVNTGTLKAGGANSFSNLSAFTLGANTVVDLNNTSQAVGSISTTGLGAWINLGSGRLTVGGDNTSTTFSSGSIFGTGGLTKVGSGTLTLATNASYTGATMINAGTLRFSGAMIELNSDVTVGTGATLDVSSSGNFGTLRVSSLEGAGNVLIGGLNVRLCGNDAADKTFSGVVSGTGGLTICGHLTLSGQNTYTGATSIEGTLRLTGINSLSTQSNVSGGGTLIISGSQDLNGTGPLNTILDGGTLTVGRNSTGLSSMFSVNGNGTFIKEGTGTLLLGRASTQSGFVLVNNGVLRSAVDADAFSANAAYVIGNGARLELGSSSVSRDQAVGSLAGSGVVDVRSSRLTAGALNTNTIFSGMIVGTGGLTKVGGGSLTLAGLNTYTGSTLIAGGTLRTGATNAISASNFVDISFGATLDLGGFSQDINTFGGSGSIQLSGSTFTVGSNSSTSTFGGAIAGSGAVIKNGTGALRLSGANTYSGQTTINSGSIQALNAGTFSVNSGYVVASGATLDLNSSAQSIGDLSGTGTVRLGSATLTAGATGASTTFAGLITGTGGFTKTGAGTMTFATANTYSGGTTILGGTLMGTTSTLFGTIRNDATLTFDQAFDGAFAGALTGTGRVVKTGAGTLRLTGSPVSSGGLAIGGGTVWLDGTFTGNTSVLGGSTLFVSTNAPSTINGKLDATGLVRIGSAVTPAATGVAGGQLNVSDGVSFMNGGTLSIDANAAGNSGRLVAGGAAVFNSALLRVNALTGSYARSTSYNIVQASGFSGTPTVIINSSTLRPYLTVHSGMLVLTLIDQSAALAGLGTSAGGKSLASAFDTLRQTATGDVELVSRELSALDDAGVASALDAMSGQVYATSVHMIAADSEHTNETILDMLKQRSVTRADRNTGSTARRLPFWFSATHQRSEFDADNTSGAHGANITLNGGIAGSDWQRGNWTAGVAGSYSKGRMTLTELTDTNAMSIARGAVFVERALGGSRISAGASDARIRSTVRRSIVFAAMSSTGGALFGGINRSADGATTAWSQDAWAAWRHSIGNARWSLEPSASARYARYTAGDVNETGAGVISLHSTAAPIESVQGGGGVRIARRVARTRSFASVDYQREFGNRDSQVPFSLSDSASTPFTASGLSFSPNVIKSQLGFVFSAQRADMSLQYDGRFSNTLTRHAIQLSIVF